MKAAIYIRVSTATKSKQRAETTYDQNPDVQEQPLRELARLDSASGLRRQS
jgi:hypothetical protein